MISQHDIDHVPEEAKGCVLAIGNFDGLHLGHRTLVLRAREIAFTEKAPLGVLTFEPHPRQFFQQNGEPFRLTLPRMKARLLEGLGVRHLFTLPFDTQLAETEAADFIDRILVEKLAARHIVVGGNFAFGKKRKGTVEMLHAAARAGKFSVTSVPPVSAPSGETYSSTAIRALLQAGKLKEAHKLLGWPWQIEAEVVKGDQRGRALGFPTANQEIGNYLRIPFGIYAVRVKIEGETQWREGVANFGIRPMFAIARPIFETHIFNFDQDIYGKNMLVQPVQFLRQELAFQEITHLVSQMKEDCIKAKAVLKSNQTFN